MFYVQTHKYIFGNTTMRITEIANAQAQLELWKLVNEFELHPALCYLDKTPINLKDLPEVSLYNQRLQLAVESIKSEQRTYLIKEGSSNYILVEEGRFYGMGTVEQLMITSNLEELKSLLKPYPENEVLRALLRSYTERYPQQLINL